MISLFSLMMVIVLSACTSNDGEAPPENEQGWKDSFSVAPDETVKIAIQFKNKGVYMFHCHILEHEDNGMMGQIKVE